MHRRNLSGLVFIMFLFISLVLLQSCSKDSITDPGGNTFDGGWTVDQVRIVSAPSGSGLSAMMKQALVPFGSVSGSFVGYMDVNFNIEHFALTNTAFSFMSSLERMDFRGNTGYALSGFQFSQLNSSRDGGSSWNNLNFPSGLIIDFYLADENKIYVLYNTSTGIGNLKRLNKSTDGGVTWDTLTTNLTASIYNAGLDMETFVFTDDLNGHLIAVDGIYKTVDGGRNWNRTVTITNETPIGIKFDQNTGIAISLDHNFTVKSRKTVDGGNTWTGHDISGSSYQVKEAIFLNASTGWVYIYGFESNSLFKTNDGGQSWNEIYKGTRMEKICFIDANVGYASSKGIILKTNDGGVSWNPISSPEAGQFITIQNVNGQPVYFMSFGILRYSGQDPSKWSGKGKIINSAIKLITQAKDEDIYVNGEYNTSNSTIAFTINNYSQGGNQRVGAGTYAFENGLLNITLDLPDDEKWEIRLRRR